MNKGIAVLLIVTLISGCATPYQGAAYRPVVDMQNKDVAVYESDLKACQGYATQVTGAAQRAAQGAAFGAVMGAALMAAAGGNRTHMGQGASLGVLSGATAGGVAGEQHQRSIIIRCLVGRGYAVLG